MLVKQVSEDLTRMLTTPKIHGLDLHFAGYFNELGITVHVAKDLTDDEMTALATLALNYLNSILPKKNAKFDWQLAFRRSDVLAGLFFPGDSPADNCAGF